MGAGAGMQQAGRGSAPGMEPSREGRKRLQGLAKPRHRSPGSRLEPGSMRGQQGGPG